MKYGNIINIPFDPNFYVILKKGVKPWFQPPTLKNNIRGQWCSSLVEGLFSVFETLGLIYR